MNVNYYIGQKAKDRRCVERQKQKKIEIFLIKIDGY
jgi:hypothetical protein